MRIIHVKSGIVIFIYLFVQVCAYPQTISISWEAPIKVLPGMNNELPQGVVDGMSISGSFTYNTAKSPSAWRNDFSAYVYYVDSWNLNLGNFSFSRNSLDGLGIMGGGDILIMNNDPTNHDYMGFTVSIDPGSLSFNVNEYLFKMTFQDNDNSAWNSANPLPSTLNFSQFENINLSIKRIKIGTPSGVISIAEMSGLTEINLTEIPEPASIFLLALGALSLKTKKFKTKN